MFPFSAAAFTPEADIPSLAGKVIVITGSNGGLGYESLIHLARQSPAKIYLCARTRAKYDEAMKGITVTISDARHFVEYLELDLASLASVKKAAETFIAGNDRLDILMNNAGIMAQPPSMTNDGFEVQFGTNHMVSCPPEHRNHLHGAEALTSEVGPRIADQTSVAHPDPHSVRTQLRRPHNQPHQRRPRTSTTPGRLPPSRLPHRHVHLLHLDPLRAVETRQPALHDRAGPPLPSHHQHGDPPRRRGDEPPDPVPRGAPVSHDAGAPALEGLRDGSEPGRLGTDVGGDGACGGQGVDAPRDEGTEGRGAGEEWSVLHAGCEGGWADEVGGRCGAGREAVDLDGRAVED